MKASSLFIVVCILSSCSIKRLERLGVYRESNPDEFVNLIQDSSVHIIDVRTSSEYEKSRIPNSTNISYLSGGFKDSLDRMDWDKSLPVMIYCETQHRSLFAAKILYKSGYTNIIDLDKGMMNWRKKGYPTDTLTVSNK